MGRQVSKQRLYKFAISITSESPLLEFVFILPEPSEKKGKERKALERERKRPELFSLEVSPRGVVAATRNKREGRGEEGKVEIGRWDGRRRSQRERENLISR